jgi:TRAP-type transport system small permease protein
MQTFHRWFAVFDRVVVTTLKWVCIALFVVLTLLLTANILIRFFPVMSLHWFDEIVEMVFAGLVFYGAAILCATRGFFSVGDWISPRLPGPRARHAYRLVIELAVLAFVLVFLRYAFELAARAEDLTNALQMPKAVLYSSMPISGAIMTIYCVKYALVELVALLHPQR